MGILMLLIGISSMVSCVSNPDPKQVIELKVDSLLARMTLDEKIGQMSQVRHFKDIVDEDIATKFIGSVIHTQGTLPGITAKEWQQRFIELQKIALSTRLGIPLLFGVDAVHGQNTYEGATIFPHSIGLGASQNEVLVEKIAKITAIEMEATGFNWTFSPCLAIPYNEKWGRVYEAFSEDTHLTTKLSLASIRGYQGDDENNVKVLATAKHYIGDGSTDYGIEGDNTTLSLAEVDSILLPPYRRAVEEGTGAVMVSFNSLMGETMHANKIMITDTLKNSMGFDGIVVTDWQGYSRFGGNKIIEAGVDMIMAVDGDLDYFQYEIKKAVLDSSINEDRINDAVRRILRQKFRLGLFENPFPDTTLHGLVGCQEHRNIARQAVRESLVLLKNNRNVLPLRRESDKIVVVGEHADNSGFQSGGWTVAWQGVWDNYAGATTILEGIQKYSSGEVVYDKGGEGNHLDADVAIIVVGETPYAEFMGDIGDGAGYHKLTLTEKHQEYISKYSQKGIDLIVILISGRPLVVTNQIDQADAFIAAWLPGSEGDGIAEVLFGDYNFSGKLPHSWPMTVDEVSGKYGHNYWDNNYSLLYKIGYGLTYRKSNVSYAAADN